MGSEHLGELLAAVASGECSVDDALDALVRLPFADLGFARVDHHRPLRQGFPEAVYAPGKTPEHCAAIVRELIDGPTGGPVLLTRATTEQADAALAACPGGSYDPLARLAVWRPADLRPGRALVVAAGTADIPVAREAAVALEALGWKPGELTDVGVAGIHRLLSEQDALRTADAIVVVAGMEGALASAVGGLVAAPVVAVPTSAGYGASFAGMTALLAMLASCAPGVAVVGIDNGYGAACAVARILGTRE